MKTLAIYPLGNNDLKSSDQQVLKDNYKNFIEELYENVKDNEKIKLHKNNELYFEVNGSKYYLPLLKAALKVDEISLKENIDIKIIFIATNQSDEKYSKKDTISLAKLLKVILERDKFGVEIFEINDKPNDLKLMIKSIQRFKSDFKDMLDSKEYEKVIFFGPGTPQINHAIIIELYDIFDAFWYYLEETGSGETKASKIHISKIIGTKILKEDIKSLLDIYDYQASYNISKNLSDKFNPPKEIELQQLEQLLEILYLRSIFVFDEAYEKLNSFLISDSEKDQAITELAKKLKKDLENLKKKDDKYLIYELYNRIVANICGGKINEGIAMLFRLEESLGKAINEKLLDTEIFKDSKTKKFDKFINAIENNPDLTEYLKKYKVDFTEPNRLVYTKIIAFFSEKSKDEHKKKIAQAFLDFTHEFDQENEKLSDLRNNTPYAHGFEGISKETLEKRETSDKEIVGNLSKNLKKLFKVLNWNEDLIKDCRSEDFVFNEINRLLKQVYLEK
ncbi:hypothetical protein [Caldisericum sp.]|uniref:hypothetical protein n=1 Tax=Caldisericum sp. TaxID=2499687 RepID=UPI003D136A37